MAERNIQVKKMRDYAEEAAIARLAQRSVPFADRKRGRVQEEANREEILAVLSRASYDHAFAAELSESGATALDGYKLSMEEKAAILSGDIRWLEDRVGPLTGSRKIWLNLRQMQERW